MKHHPELLQLSREHHAALKLALHARRAAESGDPNGIAEMAQRVASFFSGELDRHFHAEEQGVLVFLKRSGKDDLARRILAEHDELRRLIGALSHPEAAILLSFADLLAAHVRFEERELFPLAETMQAPASPCSSASCGEIQ